MRMERGLNYSTTPTGTGSEYFEVHERDQYSPWMFNYKTTIYIISVIPTNLLSFLYEIGRHIEKFSIIVIA
jgi:hypothetical protein